MICQNGKELEANIMQIMLRRKYGDRYSGVLITEKEFLALKPFLEEANIPIIAWGLDPEKADNLFETEATSFFPGNEETRKQILITNCRCGKVCELLLNKKDKAAFAKLYEQLDDEWKEIKYEKNMHA